LNKAAQADEQEDHAPPESEVPQEEVVVRVKESAAINPGDSAARARAVEPRLVASIALVRRNAHRRCPGLV
jgi:hypothetical protein